MSAAVVEIDPQRPKKKKVNRRTGKDRIQVLLKPHIRMRMSRMAEDEGFDSLGLFGRQLIMEALEARGFPANRLLSDWHAELSLAAQEGEQHPFAK